MLPRDGEAAGITTKLYERLELGPQAAARARIALAPLEEELPSESVEDLRLLVSELVTNSFRHAGLGSDETVVLTVDVGRGRVHVEVEDRGRGFTHRPSSARPLERESGWGLTIVDRLADRWGVDQNGTTVVWFDLVLGREPEPGRSNDSAVSLDAR